MKYAENLMLSKSIKYNGVLCKRKITKGSKLKDYYLLCIDQFKRLIIIDPAELNNSYFPKAEIVVVGIAKGMDDAYEFVSEIIMNCYRENIDDTTKMNIGKYCEEYFKIKGE